MGLFILSIMEMGTLFLMPCFGNDDPKKKSKTEEPPTKSDQKSLNRLERGYPPAGMKEF